MKMNVKVTESKANAQKLNSAKLLEPDAAKKKTEGNPLEVEAAIYDEHGKKLFDLGAGHTYYFKVTKGDFQDFFVKMGDVGSPEWIKGS
jgi:hypothetical protein